MRVRSLALLATTAVLASVYSCGGVTEVAMTPTGCVPVLTPTTQNASARGDAFAVSVTVGKGCDWTAASDAPWVTLTRASGSGSGSAAYTVDANTTGAQRQAAIRIGDQSVVVMQSPADCTFALAPASRNVDAGGGTVEFQLATSEGCTWTASTTEGWLSLTTERGTGPGTVSATATPHAGRSPRSASITLEGQTVSVSQDGACSFDVTPQTGSIGPNGGVVTARIDTADDTCSWTANPSVDWIRVEPREGRGKHTITITGSANDRNEPRHGTVEVAGRSIRISQQAECSVTLSSNAIGVPADGGTATVTVTTGPGCVWRTQDVPPWVTVTPSAGTGSASITVSVASSSTQSSRTGTFRLGDQSVTVTQGPVICDISLLPASADNVPATGGGREFNVRAPAGCPWTASTTDAWIRILSGASGTGNGLVTIDIAANAGAARSGRVNVGNRTFAVSQAAAPCTLAVTYSGVLTEGTEVAWAGTIEVGGEGTRFRLRVDTAAHCAWRSSPVPAWITGVEPEGTGPDSFDAQVLCNPDDNRRTAVTIAGRTATIAQDFLDSGSCGPVESPIGAARPQRRP